MQTHPERAFRRLGARDDAVQLLGGSAAEALMKISLRASLLFTRMLFTRIAVRADCGPRGFHVSHISSRYTPPPPVKVVLPMLGDFPNTLAWSRSRRTSAHAPQLVRGL